MAECFWRDLELVTEECLNALTPTIYTRQQTFTQPGGNGLDTGYASVVAIEWDRAVVGSRDAGALSKQGTAFIYEYTTAWALAATLTHPSASANDALGDSVDMDRDYMIAGAPGSTNGEAHVFFRDAGVWAWQDELLASDAAAGDQLGKSAVILGIYALVGAPYANSGGTDRGQVYAYKRTGTVWAQTAILTASDQADSDYFGASMAVGYLSYDTLVIGAPGRNSAAGAIYHFRRSGDVWTEQEIVTAPTPVAAEEYGTQLSLERFDSGNPNLMVQAGNANIYRVWYGTTFATAQLVGTSIGLASTGSGGDAYIVVPIVGPSGYELEVYEINSGGITLPYQQLPDETMYAREGAEPFELDGWVVVNTEQSENYDDATLGHMIAGFWASADYLPAIHEVGFFSYVIPEPEPG